MKDDFLDVDEAQGDERIRFDDVLRGIVAYAVVGILEVHPAKTSMPPTLVMQRAGETKYSQETDLAEHVSIDELLEATAKRLAVEQDVIAYALVVDSADGIEGFPDERPLDSNGEAFVDAQPVIAVYLGEKDRDGGALVVQAYRRRMLRGGATPMGAPLLLPGPEPML